MNVLLDLFLLAINIVLLIVSHFILYHYLIRIPTGKEWIQQHNPILEKKGGINDICSPSELWKINRVGFGFVTKEKTYVQFSAPKSFDALDKKLKMTITVLLKQQYKMNDVYIDKFFVTPEFYA